MKTSQTMIEIIDLHKTLGNKKILRGVNLNIKKGETRVIIGQSGCGKSVLLKNIISLMQPNSGEIIIEGVSTTGLKEKDKNKMMNKFGMLFQGAALFDSLTIGENIAFRQIKSRKFSQKEIDHLVDEKLSLVGLSNISNHKPSELSGGMQKRVGLARAIASNPDIILYDEPTTGLDPITADQINDLIIHLQNILNITSIAVTHDMVSAYKIADNISMLMGGVVIETGTPTQIKKSKNEFVKQFISGNSEGPIKNIRGF